MIFVTSENDIQGEKIRLEGNCEFCGTPDSVIIEPIYKLHAIFFIPTYCYEVEYERFCEHCKTEMPTDKYDLDKEARKKVRLASLQHSFFGTLLLIIILGLIVKFYFF